MELHFPITNFFLKMYIVTERGIYFLEELDWKHPELDMYEIKLQFHDFLWG